MQAQEALRAVLVRPRDPNNIGAAARALANFGLGDLWVVAPHPPVWREAKSAVGAEELLKRAREARTIAEAVAGCRAVWAASSLKARRPELPVYALPSLPSSSGPVAVLFGPEKTGLSAEDLAHASAIVRAPTAAACPSMNLAAAVAVFAYAWATRGVRGATPAFGPAPLEHRDRLWRALDALAGRAGWPEGERRRRLKAAAYRTNATEGEIGLLLALVRAPSRRKS